MLPDSLAGSYQAYKDDTSAYVTWLADSARAFGFMPANENVRTPRKSKNKQTKDTKPYILTSVDISTCTDVIVNKARTIKGGFQVPGSIIRTAERAINLRLKFLDWFTNQIRDAELDDSNHRHDHFISTLEQSLSKLRPLRAPKPAERVHVPSSASAAAMKDKDSNGLSNRFHLLKMDNPKERNRKQASPDQSPKTSAPASTRTSIFEPIATKEDPALMAIFCCLNDLHDIENQVSKIWIRYAAGEVDLVTASMVTNAAYELGMQLEADLHYEHPTLGNWEEICLKITPTMETSEHCDQGTTLKTTRSNRVATPKFMYADTAAALYFCLLVGDLKTEHEAIAIENPDLSLQDRQLQLRGILERRPRKRLTDCLKNVRQHGLEHDRQEALKKTFFILINATLTQLDLREDQPVPLKDHLSTAMMEQMCKDDCACTLPLSLVFMCHLHEAITRILEPIKDRPLAQLQQSVDMIMGSSRHSAQDRSCGCTYHEEEDTREFFHALHDVDPTDLTETSLRGMSYDMKHGMPLKETFPLVAANPVCTGLTLLRFDVAVQQAELDLCNRSESIMALAHLYNACVVCDTIKEKWLDIEEVIELCNSERVFLGDRPHDPVTFRNRYILSAGISLSAFARNRNGDCVEHQKGRLKSHWIGSEQRRRKLVCQTPLCVIFHKQASSSEGQISCLCSEVQDRLVKPKTKGVRTLLKPLEYLEQFSQAISEEAAKLHYPFLQMDSLCQNLLMGLSILDRWGGADMEEGRGPHASLVYDLLYSAYHACPTCRNVSGDKTIMPAAGDLISKIAASVGNESVKFAKASYARRFEPKLPKMTCNKHVEPEQECEH